MLSALRMLLNNLKAADSNKSEMKGKDHSELLTFLFNFARMMKKNVWRITLEKKQHYYSRLLNNLLVKTLQTLKSHIRMTNVQS